MAISAKFIADFSSFNDAVRKAEVELRGFEVGANKVSESLSRMTDRFSGRRITTEATLMVEAVERLGGVSKLTEKELAQVGATANEAAAKLRAMGKDVPPGIQNIVDKTAHLNTTSSALIGTLKSVAGAFGIAFSVQQIVGFVSKTLTAASAIKDMADKLGIGTQAAQEFAFAAQQTGAEMGDVERAIFNMNKGLATGDKSTVAALNAAGLAFADIRSQSPEDAFKAIAEAVKQIPDPMLQAKVAAELFGKAGKDLLPAIKEGFVKIGEEAPKMADATIKSLERAQDAWDKFGKSVTTVSGELIATLMELPTLASNVTSSLEKFKNFAIAIATIGPGAALAMEHFREATKGTDIALKPMAQTLAKTKDELAEEAKAAEKAKQAQEQFNQQLRAFKNDVGIREMEDYAAAQKAAAEAVAENVRLEFAMNKLYRDNAKEITAYEQGVGLLSTGFQSIGKLMPGVVKNITDSGKALKGGLGDFLKNGVKDLFGGASSISGGISNMLKGIGTGIFESLGSMITGGISTLISKGIGLVGKGLGKLFGFDGEKKKVDEMRQAFIDAIGGWEGLNKAAQKTGLTLNKVLNARTVKDYEKAVAELQRRIALQETAWSKVQAAIERYGFTIEQLGPALQKQKLTETALQLYEDFQLLVASGIDIETVLTQMSGKINEFVHLAIKMGFEVDRSMKPMLQKMIEMGLLTDANGNLITNLEESGITFSESVTEAFAAVADSLKEMIELLKIFLGLSNQAAVSVGNIPAPPPPATPQPGGGHTDPGTGVDIPDVPGFAKGSGGRYLDFGKGTLAMLHGKEKITPYGEGDGQWSVAALQSELQGLRADLVRQQRLLPKQLRDAMQLAMA